jgi:hypothetical protein
VFTFKKMKKKKVVAVDDGATFYFHKFASLTQQQIESLRDNFQQLMVGSEQGNGLPSWLRLFRSFHPTKNVLLRIQLFVLIIINRFLMDFGVQD